jgi:hypothetical protein
MVIGVVLNSRRRRRNGDKPARENWSGAESGAVRRDRASRGDVGQPDHIVADAVRGDEA